MLASPRAVGVAVGGASMGRYLLLLLSAAQAKGLVMIIITIAAAMAAVMVAVMVAVSPCGVSHTTTTMRYPRRPRRPLACCCCFFFARHPATRSALTRLGGGGGQREAPAGLDGCGDRPHRPLLAEQRSGPIDCRAELWHGRGEERAARVTTPHLVSDRGDPSSIGREKC